MNNVVDIHFVDCCKRDYVFSFFRKIAIFICFVMNFSTPLSTMAAACTPCISTPGESIWTMVDKLRASSCAGTLLRNSDLPITLTTPGIYSLCENIQYTGLSPAITITPTTGPIYFNMTCHSITIETGSVGGAFAISPSSPVTIVNGFIVSNHATVNLIQGNSDFSIENVNFGSIAGFNGTGCIGINLAQGVGMRCKDCIFTGLDAGISANINTNLFYVDHCTFVDNNLAGLQDINPAAISTLGNGSGTITNCVFQGGADGILLNNTTSWSIETCYLNGAGSSGAAIHLVNCQNVFIRDIFIENTRRPAATALGIWLDGTIGAGFSGINNISITDSYITDCNAGGIFSQECISVAIVNCKISSCSAFGIHLTSTDVADAADVLVQSNQVSFCSGGGIFVMIPGGDPAVFNNTVVRSTPAYSAQIIASGLVATTFPAISTATFWWNVAV